MKLLTRQRSTMPRLALTGDVMLGRNVADAIREHGPAHPWGEDVLERLEAAEGVGVNLECVIAERGTPDPDRTFNFRAPPAAVETLSRAHVDVATLANNHVLDFGPEALEETWARLDDAGIAHTGSGPRAELAWRPARVDVAGQDVVVLAFTDNVRAWDVERRRPGVAWARVDPDSAGIQRLAEAVRGLARSSDLVVVSAHWGPNMRRTPPERFRTVARGLIEAGADIFWGHSAHLFQAVERHQGGVILYDTGDFVDDYRIDPDEHNEISFLFELSVHRGRVGAVELVPVRIDPTACRVEIADASAAGFAHERMASLCEPFGTELVETEDGHLRVPVEEHPGREGS